MTLNSYLINTHTWLNYKREKIIEMGRTEEVTEAQHVSKVMQICLYEKSEGIKKGGAYSRVS